MHWALLPFSSLFTLPPSTAAKRPMFAASFIWRPHQPDRLPQNQQLSRARLAGMLIARLLLVFNSLSPGGSMKRIMGNLKHSTILGLCGGLFLVLGMMLLAPEHIGAFFNIPGLIVVIGGTLTATLVSRPVREVKRALHQIPTLLKDHRPSAEAEVRQLLNFVHYYRGISLRKAELYLQTIQHPVLRTGMRHIIDGGNRDELIKQMRYRLQTQKQRADADVNILRTMAVYAPAFGMLGTLFGLIHMLQGLGASDIAHIGTSMAFAMITTLYGIVAANLFLKPLAMKLEQRQQQELTLNHMLSEGLLLVQERRHPQYILDALEVFGVQQQTLPMRSNVTPLPRAA